MLRNQPSHRDPMDFLAGQSEMARLIRKFDWTHHPLGPPASWPQSLRSALSICLHSAFPTAIYWGSELRLLYNDAWAPIPGPRHPAALGAPAREVWADIWHVIEPQFRQLIATGEGLFVQDQFLPMQRFGIPEETYWSYSFTAIRGEDGSIVGVFNSGNETTETVLAQRRMSLLLKLGEVLRGTTDPQRMRKAAVEMLGEHLGVQHVRFHERAPGDDTLALLAEWPEALSESDARAEATARIDAWTSEVMRDGQVLRIDDVRNDPATAETGLRTALEEMNVAAIISVPQMLQGQLITCLSLESGHARSWNDADITTVEQVLERTWSWMERELAAERERIMLREIDHRARNTLAVVQAMLRQTHADDLPDFRARIDARIAALARVHSLLSAEHWNAIDLTTLVEQELAPYTAGDSPRAAIAGPQARMPAEAAQSMALVLHELVTNAAKHGALAHADGAIAVTWQIDDEGSLVLDWQETLPGRSVVEPASGSRGFGSVLLDAVVTGQLHGAIDREWQDGGLRCRISIPLDPARGFSIQSSPSQSVASGRRGVLIAEDEAIVAFDLAAQIEDLGHEVFGICHSIADTMAAIAEDTPDLAVLDFNLAGEPSLPVAELLHDRGVPIVFTTGYARLAGLPAHMENVPRLMKPIDGAMLTRAIAEALAAGPRRKGSTRGRRGH